MKRNFLNRSVAMLLAMVLLLTGCVAAKPGDTTAATDTTTAPAPDQTTGAADGTVSVSDKAITFFSVNLNTNGVDNCYLMAYPNGDGTAYVEYVGEVKKIGSALDEAVLNQIVAALEQSGMMALNNRNEYEDGAALASAYVEFGDGTMLSCSFTGAIPQEYADAYGVLDACFQTVTADVEVYVPMPMINGEVNAEAKDELLQILEKTGIKELDMFQISDVLKDDAFAYIMGLSSADGIAVGTNCSAMMMTTPYSLVIATLEEGTDAQTVRDDFLANLDWQKWVCVMPTGALVAQKGNMVLCLMGADSMFSQTVQAITGCGWENLETVDAPAA